MRWDRGKNGFIRAIRSACPRASLIYLIRIFFSDDKDFRPYFDREECLVCIGRMFLEEASQELQICRLCIALAVEIACPTEIEHTICEVLRKRELTAVQEHRVVHCPSWL